jgi:putative DNA primase/helicase
MIDVERLPEAILNAPAVVWKWVDDGFDKEGKPKRTKPPFRAVAPNDLASTTDPTTWSTFAEAVDTYLDGKADGVGIVFCNGMAGVDLDHCRDPETGTIEDWAWKIIRKLDSYTEVSPSGTGIHILVYGALPEGRKKDGARGIEMYDSERGRYFTVTCQHLEGTKVTVKNRQAELAALHAECSGKTEGARSLHGERQAPRRIWPMPSSSSERGARGTGRSSRRSGTATGAATLRTQKRTRRFATCSHSGRAQTRHA